MSVMTLLGLLPLRIVFIIEKGEIHFADKIYQLIGVIDHIGETPSSGHYISFLKVLLMLLPQ